MPRWVWGRNPVIESLRSGRQVLKLFTAPNLKGNSIRTILFLAQKRGIKAENVAREYLDEVARGGNHQGVALLVPDFSYTSLGALCQAVSQAENKALVFLLDQLQDPHNLGATIRVADACGALGVVITKHRSAGVTEAVVKASAGASEHVPVVQVTNMVRAMEELKRAGLWLAGAALEADMLYTNAPLAGPIGLVIGSEGYGIRRLVRENCDLLVRLPMYGKVNSLNASVAAGVLGYEVIRQRAVKQEGAG